MNLLIYLILLIFISSPNASFYIQSYLLNTYFTYQGRRPPPLPPAKYAHGNNLVYTFGFLLNLWHCKLKFPLKIRSSFI